MSYIQGQDRDQRGMFPALLDDYVPEGHLVRIVDRYTEVQDLAALGFGRAEPAATGRPGYDPRLMLKLYLYGYLNRVRSSRRLEAEAQRNIELMWLLGKLAPDFKTIADFRRDNGPAVRLLCRGFSEFCVRQGLMKGELVAIDGSKFAGVNHKGRNFNADKLQRRLQELDQKIAAYLKELDANDAADEGQGRADPEAVRQALHLLESRKAQLRQHQQALQSSGERQVSLTDPDARAMQSGGGGAVVGYNVQMAVDAHHKLIVNFEICNDGNDRNQLADQAQAAQQILGNKQLEVVADAGYAHGTEYARCEQAGITAYVPQCPGHNNDHHGLLGKQRFVYDPATDTYRCPADQLLTYRGSKRPGERRYRTDACSGCALLRQCTRDQRHGREIIRMPDAAAVEAMARRVQRHPDKTKLRKTIVEHPFGTIKRSMNQGYFLTRRLPKVTTEMSLTVLSYNLRRVFNILGAQKMMQALQPA
jgi:transposase